MIYLQLFFEFFKTGLFATGGGLATIPFLRDIAARYPWFTEAELIDMIAVAESTPGPIGVNCATYAGFQSAGVPGALVATLALVLPSFLVITVISRVLSRFSESLVVKNAFGGLRPAVTGLIAAAGYSVLSIALFSSETGLFGFLNLKGLLLFVLLFFLSRSGFVLKKREGKKDLCLKDLHPLAFIGLAALAGVLFKF